MLSRLADPAVPGAQKLNLVEGATPDSAAVFDQFAKALINGGYAPVKFDVRDVALVRPGPRRRGGQRRRQLTAIRKGPRFAFPMEFKPYQGGWQLSARTADVLLGVPGRTRPQPPATTPGH